ncbi:odorant receptor 131-2-like [Micropterus salmoides]|uniref:odorant receptor 131-2-like n=1 Tax=Micropterus salmoides TaxID=27706 RepID=UPI0018EB1F19|nr:odorant receptor 131-2-like [Micropterus salmoides]
MSYSNQSQTNISVELQYQGFLEIVLLSIVTTVPCCVFLFINVTLLFTLRSKPVFCETSRYILLFNLLLVDTLLMAEGQLMYIMAAWNITMKYPVCGFLNMLAYYINEISPLTLVVMCLERFVAVCYPLRHAAIITVRNTGVAVCVVWAFSSLSVFIQVLLMLKFPFAELESLQMRDFCGKDKMMFDPVAADYDKAYNCFLFVLAGVAVISSYIGVMIAARSASTDKASAHKARNTLLLHLVQLGLSLSSTVYNPLLVIIAENLDGLMFLRIQNIIYICTIMFPRCLSALIYGLRDQTIRPVLMYNLCCQRFSPLLSVVQTKAKISKLFGRRERVSLASCPARGAPGRSSASDSPTRLDMPPDKNLMAELQARMASQELATGDLDVHITTLEVKYSELAVRNIQLHTKVLDLEARS